jgi:ATP diphosphatase
MTDADNLARLLAIMARLRDPERGCPWDLEQDFASIAPYTIEEAYEVAEAIAENDMPALKDELGDLLLQVVFHARMAEEAGHFAFDDVAQVIADKMIRRHPHVFGTARIASAEAQTTAWEAVKAAERQARAAPSGEPRSALDGVGLALPALTRAAKIQGCAARVGFDWPDIEPVFDKIAEEIGELRAELAVNAGKSCAGKSRIEDEAGDLLFALVNLTRHLKLDPEAALRRATSKFERRFRKVEQIVVAKGKTLDEATLDEMEAAWQEAKAEGL